MSVGSQYNRQPHVLLVEDSPEVAILTRSHLEQHGFPVVEVTSGEAALDHLAQADPFAIILDVGLPGIDGLETCRRIRLTSDVHVIMWSARTGVFDRRAGFAAGADYYVAKSGSPAAIVARLHAVQRRLA